MNNDEYLKGYKDGREEALDSIDDEYVNDLLEENENLRDLVSAYHRTISEIEDQIIRWCNPSPYEHRKTRTEEEQKVLFEAAKVISEVVEDESEDVENIRESLLNPKETIQKGMHRNGVLHEVRKRVRKLKIFLRILVRIHLVIKEECSDDEWFV